MQWSYCRTGTVTAANSLVGTTTNDRFGSKIVALDNGNYVAASPLWDQPSPLVANVGAAAWANGSTGLAGTIGPQNALVGTSANDNVGSEIHAIPGGGYIVRTPTWDLPSPLRADAGAVTWCDGSAGRTGAVSSANSLHGSTADDRFGQTIPAFLPNGKYVVGSAAWDKPAPGAVSNVGVITLCFEGNPVGPVTTANSLTGVNTGDLVGSGAPGITVLTNGNFVVASQFWQNPATGATAAGAVTWCEATTGRAGQSVTPANSLVGSSVNDWFSRVIPLANGNFVAFSPNWNSLLPAREDAGAVVWCPGNAGRPGETVGPPNALVGSTPEDLLGDGGRVVALANGHYLVGSHVWDHPVNGASDIGMVIWCNGTSGRTGPIDPLQALVGSVADDRVGARGIFALSNGHYVVPTGNWNASRGAVTWGDGFTGFAGTISPDNSLVGNLPSDNVGDTIVITPDGNYYSLAESYTHNGVDNAGAVAYGFGVRGTRGIHSTANSVFGTLGDSIRSVKYDSLRSRLLVGRGSPSVILVFRPPPLAEISTITKSPASLQLTLPLLPQQNAGIEYAETLPPPNGWTDLGPMTLNASTGTYTETNASRLARPTGFYRAYPR